MFGELDDSDIYENGRGSDAFGVPSGHEDEQNGFGGSFDAAFAQQEDEQQQGILGLDAAQGYASQQGVQGESSVQPSQDPFSDAERIQNMKPKASSGLVYIALLAVLFVAAAGMFAYKKFFSPEQAPEQSMGDMFYDQANGQNPAPADNTATVDVDLGGGQPAAPVETQAPAAPADAVNPQEPAKTAQAENAEAQKPMSAIEKAMAKKKADDAKMNKLVPDKSVVVAVSSGGRADPFLPYGAVEAMKNKPKFDLIAPPLEIPEADPVVDEVMQTKISGIMYEKNRPSAIVNFGESDQLVHKGDTIKGLKILDITKNTVVIKYKSNIYQATVGQTLDSGVNLNPVSGLNNQFGGAYGGSSKNVIQFNN